MSNDNPLNSDIIFRRTTLIVRDIEESLNLYQKCLGMESIYDQVYTHGEKTIRLIFLKTVDEHIGVIGLVDYAYDDPNAEVKQKPVKREGFTPQNTVLVFNTNDLDTRWNTIKHMDSIEIIQEPTLTEYPSYDGQDVIRVNVSKFYDPDGYLVELNHIVSGMDKG